MGLASKIIAPNTKYAIAIARQTGDATFENGLGPLSSPYAS